MIAPDLTEPVDAPVEPEPDTVEAWRALVAKLQAKIAEIEGPPDRLLTLKNAAYTERVDTENLRRWYWAGKVTGEKRHGNIFISQRSLKEYLKPRRDRD
jgi:hypothetical protein